MDYMSGVGCHMSPVTNANSYGYRPSPANSPTMHGRLLWKEAKTQKYVKMQKFIETEKQNKNLKKVCHY